MLTKKRIIALVLLFPLFLGAVACSSETTGGTNAPITTLSTVSGQTTESGISTNATTTTANQSWIVLRFWNGFTGDDGASMEQIVQNFNDAYADQKIMVVMDKLPWDTLFTKLLATSQSTKNAPHIVAMSASRIAGMESRDLLLPMDDVLDYLDANAEDYIPTAWNAGVLNDGHRYGFPLDIHPNGMFYNSDLVSEEEIPTTWEEFEQIAKEKTHDNYYGYAVPSMYSITKDIFLSKLYQQGGSLFDANYDPALNSAVGINVAQDMYDWVHTDHISPTDVGTAGDYTLFVQGRSAFYFDGSWICSTFNLFEPGLQTKIKVAPMPESVGEGNTSFAGSHQFTLLEATVTDDRTKNACYEFMQYVLEHSLDWAKGGQVPAYIPVHQTEEYQSYDCLVALTEMAYYVTLGEIEYEYWYEMYNFMGTAVSNVISQIYSPKDALDNAAMLFQQWREEQ